MTSSPATEADPSLWVTILAGGIGSRFWPVSTPDRPKQLLPLGSERPLIVDTVERARDVVPDERIRILAGEHLTTPFRRALPDLPAASYMLEPQARGTGPVLAWAAWSLLQEDPRAVLISLHSDHVIRPRASLPPLLREAARLALAHRALFTVAAPPDRPETGYGYIRPGAGLEDAGSGVEAFRVEAFVEKPDAGTARAYLDAGYRWNTGIFIWPAATFLEEIRAHAPEIAPALAHLERGDVPGFFSACTPISVDEAVLERSRRVCAVAAPFQWDDVGSWEALTRTREQDAGGNTVVGRARVAEGTGNIVFSEETPVVLWGVDDLVVVQTPHATLVMPRDRAPKLKDLVSRLPDEMREPDG